ncbi:MAG: hypothetical protein M3Q45_04585 [Chloroflexota bacterium]|nr:hypothetical protein [Chloroflexota bacterium]
MSHRCGFILSSIVLLLTGCARILPIPVPIFVQVPVQTTLFTNQTITQTVTSVPTVTVSFTEISAHLGQALTVAPVDARAIYFTDWALLKAYKGVPNLNSESPIDARMAFMLTLNEDQATPSVYGARAFLRFAEEWGWDSTDLRWEVTIESAGPPVHILKLRDDFDLAPVLSKFSEREFHQQTLAGTTIYTHEMALTEDWFTVGELSIANTAVISAARLLIFSSSPDALQATLDVYAGQAKSLGDDADVQTTAAALGDVAGAIITPGIDTCRGLSFDAIAQTLLRDDPASEENLAELKQKLLGGSTLHPYTGFALGYRYADDRPVGLIVMHFPNAEDAQADLAVRRTAAETGISVVTGQPLSESVFTLDDARVTGNALVLQLRPQNDQPTRLFQMFFTRDMAFAGCP